MKKAILATAYLDRQFEIDTTIRKEQGRLFSFIRKSVPSKEEAEDLVQDVFYQLVRTSQQTDSIENITSWLYRVARNKIVDLYRKKKPDTFSKIEKDNDYNFQDLLPDFNALPDGVYWQEVVWSEIEKALESMPAKQRDVFVAHEFEDKSYKEIEAETGTSINTLLSRKRYAIQFLQKQLEPLYKELLDE